MSMLLPAFELHEPSTIEEAVALRRQHADSDWLAGGTDLLPNYKWGLNTKPHVISLGRIEELREITATSLGAMARLSDVERNEEIRTRLPVVAHTARLIASPLLRAAGTVGGNVLLDNRCFFYNQTHAWRESINYCLKADGDRCHVVPQKETCYATFSADLPAPLIVLDASYELVSPKGTRSVAAETFYEGDGIRRNVRAADELLTRVTLPKSAASWTAAYHKLRTRDSWDFPELGIAAAVLRQEGTVSKARIVANALETTPRLIPEAAEAVVGTDLADDILRKAAAAVEAAVRPVRNTSLAPNYRKKMARVYAERVLREIRDGTPPKPFFSTNGAS